MDLRPAFAAAGHRTGRHGLTRTGRGTSLLAIAALHVVLGLILLRAAPRERAPRALPPTVVRLIAQPRAEARAEVTAPIAPPLAPVEVSNAVPLPTIVVAPSPTAAADAPETAAPPTTVVSPQAIVPMAASAAPMAPPPPPAAHADIPARAIQYLDEPAPVYPLASRRLGEAGLVVVRVLVGTDGLPREAQVQQSSGFARLDAAALEAVRRARFRPWIVDGQAVAAWARIPIPFELER